MNMIYLLLLAAALVLLRKARHYLPAWSANLLAGAVILLTGAFLVRALLHASSPAEIAAATLCLTGIPLAEAYWLSGKPVC